MKMQLHPRTCPHIHWVVVSEKECSYRVTVNLHTRFKPAICCTISAFDHIWVHWLQTKLTKCSDVLLFPPSHILLESRLTLLEATEPENCALGPLAKLGTLPRSSVICCRRKLTLVAWVSGGSVIPWPLVAIVILMRLAHARMAQLNTLGVRQSWLVADLKIKRHQCVVKPFCYRTNHNLSMKLPDVKLNGFEDTLGEAVKSFRFWRK